MDVVHSIRIKHENCSCTWELLYTLVTRFLLSTATLFDNFQGRNFVCTADRGNIVFLVDLETFICRWLLLLLQKYICDSQTSVFHWKKRSLLLVAEQTPWKARNAGGNYLQKENCSYVERNCKFLNRISHTLTFFIHKNNQVISWMIFEEKIELNSHLILLAINYSTKSTSFVTKTT